MRRLLVTGGAGFIGSNFIRYWMRRHAGDRVINLDALTYAGNLESLAEVESAPGYRFVHGDITNRELVLQVLREEQVDTVVNFAAESHVDRSILGPDAFINTNIQGTFALLEAAKAAGVRRFVFSSSCSNYGAAGEDWLDETAPLNPVTPYAVSKVRCEEGLDRLAGDFGLPPTLRTIGEAGPEDEILVRVPE